MHLMDENTKYDRNEETPADDRRWRPLPTVAFQQV
jgi:hypothetical protein